ncbi:MAG: hypothetical protein H6R20_432, partial [Proteobacteria bacterium]|nr:hypothetical protein [Pseudomonadota bacterium]
RDSAEVARAMEQDPLAIAAVRLASLGVADAEVARARAAADAAVAAAVAAAHAAPFPEIALAYTDIQDTGAGRWH